MEFIFELLFQLLGEFLLQAIAELLGEILSRSLKNALKSPIHPVVAALALLWLGAIAGGISLLILPTSPIADPLLRTINLFATPILIGALMATVGRLRSKRGQALVRLDRFGYAFVFAFTMALVRFLGAA